MCRPASTLSRTGNGAALFALWGTTYGAGDGSTTFNVPNTTKEIQHGHRGTAAVVGEHG
ncbi:phage tail protein [Bradyrhizobium liaoningense]